MIETECYITFGWLRSRLKTRYDASRLAKCFSKNYESRKKKRSIGKRKKEVCKYRRLDEQRLINIRRHVPFVGQRNSSD